jgi:hypothetical protein
MIYVTSHDSIIYRALHGSIVITANQKIAGEMANLVLLSLGYYQSYHTNWLHNLLYITFQTWGENGIYKCILSNPVITNSYTNKATGYISWHGGIQTCVARCRVLRHIPPIFVFDSAGTLTVKRQRNATCSYYLDVQMIF